MQPPGEGTRGRSMPFIDDIIAAREQHLAHDWLDIRHPAVQNLAHALQNGYLSLFEARLADAVVKEAVRPADGFSGAVAALSPILWVRGNSDRTANANLGARDGRR